MNQSTSARSVCRSIQSLCALSLILVGCGSSTSVVTGSGGNAAGVGGATGTAGTIGTAGATGSAGKTGTAGATGAAGVTGAGGAIGSGGGGGPCPTNGWAPGKQ